MRLAAPDREVFVMVGDGSYMMGPTELATAVAERIHIVGVLLDNHGFASIGALSRSLGSAGFGTIYRRSRDGGVALDAPDGRGPAGVTEALPIDLAANAESLGATVLRAGDVDQLRAALARAVELPGPVVIAVETDRYAGVPDGEGWWDVPVAEVSEMPAVAAVRERYERARVRQRDHLRRGRRERAADPRCRASWRATARSSTSPRSAGWGHVGFEVLALSAGPARQPGEPLAARAVHRRRRRQLRCALRTMVSGSASAGARACLAAPGRRVPAAARRVRTDRSQRRGRDRVVLRTGRWRRVRARVAGR